MIKLNGKNFKKGSLILEEIKFDHIFKRTVMKSGSVAKVYLPKELIGKNVYVIVDMNGLNDIDNVQEKYKKEAVKNGILK